MLAKPERSTPLYVFALLMCAGGLEAQQSQTAQDSLFGTIQWTEVPGTVQLGSVAEMRVPEGCHFTGASGARTLMELTHNPPSGREVGVLLCPSVSGDEDSWFVVYEFDPSGYVRDDEGKSLDADALLASIRRGTSEDNKERRSRGWDTLAIDGWVRRPYYDPYTHNLTWSTRGHTTADVFVNHSVRLLGRGGVMHIDLVGNPDVVAAAIPKFDAVISSTRFTPGHTYAEWRPGDKVASYGLTALIAGGAGAAAANMGLFTKLWKLIAGFFVALWKFVVVAVAGVIAWFRSLFRRRDSRQMSAGTRDMGP